MSSERETDFITYVVQFCTQEFNFQDYSLPSGLTPRQVEEISAWYAPRVIDQYNKLSCVVRQYEAKIHTRWVKKSKLKRREIILKAWPGIPIHHRPDVRDWAKTAGRELNLYKWPHMSLEDLSKKEPLLLMLNSRGHNPPLHFCSADLASAGFGRAEGVLEIRDLPLHYMKFSNDQLPKSYGKLHHATELKPATAAPGCSTGEGLLLLQIQDKIYEFLLEACKHILHDFTEEQLFSDSSEAHGPAAGDELNFATHSQDMADTLAVISAEAPYRAPAKPAMSVLVALFSEELAKAKEHLRQLRTHPGYFERCLVEHKTHLEKLPKDESSPPAAPSKKRDRGAIWKEAAASVVTNAIKSAYRMAYMHERVVKLNELIDAHLAHISSGVPLPAEVAAVVGDLYVHLDFYSSHCLQQLTYVFPGSPFLRPYFNLYRDASGKKLVSQARSNITDRSVKELASTLESFLRCENHVVSSRTMLLELEQHIQRDRAVGGFISVWTEQVLREIVILFQCMEQLEKFTHLEARFNSMLTLLNANQKAIVASMLESWASYDSVEHCSFDDYPHPIDPSGGRYHYPERRRQNKENIEAMRRAEANLDAIWAAALETLHGSRGDTNTLLPDVAAILQSSDIPRTKPWEEPPPRPPAPFGGFQEDPSSQPARPLVPPARPKIKTRAPATTQPAPAADPEPEPDLPPPPPPVCKVSKRVLKVMQALFYDPSAGAARAREVQWSEYMYALASLGFSARTVQGSAWEFRPPGEDQQGDGGDDGRLKELWARSLSRRPSVFHEPHPSSRISFKRVRKYGRRLRGAYGWGSETFVLDE
ncbi:hypothetical protein F4775DRAFT_587294 [Biscogniauxia sp. FL1348]|nr:hypothetical protein F4775DRAFT_587294 [Biscogniauxia sp. FL1348]